MNHLTIFTTLFFLTLINALPIPNYADRLVWASTPDTRGTLTIIFSCASALILCIWSGIHSNINPSEDDEEKQGAMSLIAKTVGKAALASIALLAPDIVLTIALHQLLVAQQYQRAINHSQEQEDKNSTDRLDTTPNSDGTEVNVKADVKIPEAIAIEVERVISRNGDRTKIAVTTDEKLPTTSINESNTRLNNTTVTTPYPVACTTDGNIQKILTMESNASEHKTSTKPTKAYTRPPNDRNLTDYSSTSNDTKVPESTGTYDKLCKTISGLTAKTWASQRGKKAGHVGLKMSFFATMGGFCFSETTLNGYHRKSLDFDALLHPNIMDIIQTHPLPEIEDKSKASGIAKTVAVIQVGWVLLQCLGRYLERLHITLLELNTCVHVVLAIVTYGIWMRKPLDVGVSIPAESNKLIHDFATAVYMDYIRSPLKEAEERIMPDSKKFIRFISDTNKSPETAYVPPKTPKILVAMIISNGMKDVAEEAGKIFYASHAAVKSSMARATIGKDIKSGVINKYFNEDHGVGSELRHLKLRDAAFESTSSFSSKFAHEKSRIAANFADAIQNSYEELRRPNIKDDQYREILNAAIQPVMQESLSEIRKESMKSSFEGVSSAAENVVGHLPYQQTTTLAAVAQSALACCRAAARHAVLHEGLRAVISRNNAEYAVETALYRLRNKCYPRAPDSNAHVENTSSVLRDAGAAVQDPESDIIPGSNAVAPDLGAKAQNSHAEVQGLNENDYKLFDTFFEAVIRTAKKKAANSFENYINNVGFERGTNISVTADIVSRYAARGILSAVEEAITDANNDILNTQKSPQPEVSGSLDSKNGTQVEVAVQRFTKDELASMRRDCENALDAIHNSKTWRMINPHMRHSIWTNFKYPFANVAGVLRNQLVDVPGLFTPSEQDRMSQASKAPAPAVPEAPIASAVESPVQSAIESPSYEIPEDTVPAASETLVQPAVESAVKPAVSEAPIKPGEHNNDNQNNQHFNKSWCQQHRIALLAISTIMGIFYGSIHITKWNSAWFPTHVEHLLWNISCCIGSVAVLPIGLSMLIPFKQERPILRGVLITLCIVSWVLFGAARVYFIVESFMSMRSLPGSAYRSVQWSNALPHF